MCVEVLLKFGAYADAPDKDGKVCFARARACVCVFVSFWALLVTHAFAQCLLLTTVLFSSKTIQPMCVKTASTHVTL